MVSILGYCRIVLRQKIVVQVLEKERWRIRTVFTRKLNEIIYKMADRQKNMDQISNFFNSNLIWSLELILK